MIWIAEAFVNKTKGYRFGECEPYETPFADDEKGKLYHWLVKEYGRCTGRVYVDTAEGDKRVGWLFVKRMHYDDDPKDTYLREVWVTLHSGPPIRTVTYQYLDA